jgi:hypothetical protein
MTEPPDASGPSDASGPVWPGYAVPGASYTAPPVRHTSRTRMFVLLSIAVVVVAAVLSLVAWLLTPAPPHYKCPPDCGRPPIGPPLRPASQPPPGRNMPAQSGPPASNRPVVAATPGPPVESYSRFSPTDGGFSVAYPRSGSRHDGSTVAVSLGTNGVEWTVSGTKGGLGDGKATLFGQTAANQTPTDIATALIQKNYPGAQRAYEIPNAMVGYQPGYGEVDDYYPQAGTSDYTRIRLVVLVAVKNGLALVATAAGPYIAFRPGDSQPPKSGPSEETDHPSGTSLDLAQRIGPFINSFTWKGDATRLTH